MASKLRVIGKNIHLNLAEREWLGVMQRQFGCTEQEALDEIIKYKREQAYMYGCQGNYALEKVILCDIDEWDDTRELEYKTRTEETREMFKRGKFMQCSSIP